MKFTYKKILFAVTALFIIALIPFIQSCSNNNELEGTEKIESSVELTASEKNEIINSTEFEEYVKANIEVTSVFLKISSLPKNPDTKGIVKTGIAPNGATYKQYPFVVDERLIETASQKFTELNKTFPSLKNCKLESIKSLIKESSLKSKTINKLFLEKGLISTKAKNVRQKTGYYEGNGIFSFADPAEAFFVAMAYSRSPANDECTGYLLNNGTAILYINPNGSHSEGVYPAPTSINCCDGVYDAAMYNGDEIIATFHTQFNGSCSSGPDEYSQLHSYPNAGLIILYQGHLYYYGYTNGYENGTQYYW